MKKRLALAAATLALMPFLANSAPLQQGTSYAGVNYALLKFSPDDVSTDIEPTALVGRLGHFVLDQIAIEGRLGLGATDDSIHDNGNEVTVEMDRLAGLYATGHVPLGEQASVYALVGYTQVKVSSSSAFGSVSDTDSGFTWGFGADIYASPQFAINAEYTRYLDETGYSFSTVSIGAKLPF